MIRAKKTMDGNTAAAYASYPFIEVAAIYPITPSSPMAEATEIWSAEGLKNIFGERVHIYEMQSEAGAAGTMHGSLNAGALTTTYTASQGLLLMVPNMYKIAGELLPCVINVTARALASHSLSIFGDHQDVYACRQTGFAMLAESNPQEVMDLTPVAYLATLKGRIPFVNFFDGFRTSHEIQKIESWDYAELAKMVDQDSLSAFRNRALNPEHPTMRGSHQNDDVYFQNREACNSYYDAFPEIVEDYMNQINQKIGTNYKLFNYYGSPEAERVIIAMGSFCDVVEEVVDYLLAQGEKIGLIKVRLYRPFSVAHFLDVLPESVVKIAVMDRTKEPGSSGEPLYLDVIRALYGKTTATIVGGRYGLSSKDTPPSTVFAIFDELKKEKPKEQFTVGIVDDVTHLSLNERTDTPITTPPDIFSCKFWGIGGDGTVGANKNSIKIIGDHTNKYVQGYFQYDSKKTGGVTISHLRFGISKIKSPYYVRKADFVACHNPSYIEKQFRIVEDVKPGGTFLINSQWTDEQLSEKLGTDAVKYIEENQIQVYAINATDIARKIGMGKRTNTILQSAFFTLSEIIPQQQAIRLMKEFAYKSYGAKGDHIVQANYEAIDEGTKNIRRVKLQSISSKKTYHFSLKADTKNSDLVNMVEHIQHPVSRMEGDDLPVSAFVPHVDGTYELGAAGFEKRGVAVEVPEWNPDLCIQCNRCAFVCPHAAIRPFALTNEEAGALPSQAKITPMKGRGVENYQYIQTVSPLDCMGCTVCIDSCLKPGALTMKSRESQMDQQPVFDYLVDHVDKKPGMMNASTVKGSQFNKPLLEFSGSCAGCAETSYARLITQLFGDRMLISNATGCSSIWGGPAAACPYATTLDNKGPAWSNSLFEDNAENGLGLYLGQKAIRERLIKLVRDLANSVDDPALKKAAVDYLQSKDDGEKNKNATKTLLKESKRLSDHDERLKILIKNKDYLGKKSVWIFGGDGWAYDIDSAGLDHILATGEDVNVFIFDTEVYSNTGGQASKASRIGQVAQFAHSGNERAKKNLTEMAMIYRNVYLAQVSMGADLNQTLKAIVEAESYHGPSLIIGYSPCEMHGIKGGMANSQKEMKRAVETGYWHNFRFDPRNSANGKNPLTIDSREPTGDYLDFIKNENRYTRLQRTFPERAEKLFEQARVIGQTRYRYLKKLQALYEPSESFDSMPTK
ncbi:pyruvate:ferredoxin (flavodoxin) oxidoreductase [Sporolactobacillus shoreicorticis]|uniref:Pyruvate:ferredoxin (Flavodoxin) oxidoreductase n=1 Tax=Sporolactobacillus shoreicorticis TaxID=1923877 RepID=A0ABW5RYZ9_9BACL|nr:pyruvate:ferredoxin (flavodoxin) oxidoreductase [Sporolactobacillus shoreicorticis]MCO7124866.1 pyruvate:ferredoxin (flavodoxin) oxidoreductase [Sporolactobacillus shoreicorticis]